MDRHRRRAFTIVELLVVIGIIGVLMSILIPAVSGMRKRARESECSNNLRVLFHATMMVTNDLGGYFPVPPKTGETTSASRKNYAMTMKPGTPRGELDYAAGGLLLKYLGENPESRQAIMYCPQDRGERPHQGGSYTGEIRNFSYSYNNQIRPSTEATIRLDRVRRPGSRIMIFEEVGPNDMWCASPGTNIDDWPSNRHARSGKVPTDDVVERAGWDTDGQGNHLFFDGHTEMMTPKKCMTGSSATGVYSYYRPLEQ